jgi:hypothetical protein
MDKNKQLTFIRPMQTLIYWKKCVNGSDNLKGHQKNIFKNRYNAYFGLDLSIYVIKSPSRSFGRKWLNINPGDQKVLECELKLIIFPYLF